jgi:hypothetical protein
MTTLSAIHDRAYLELGELYAAIRNQPLSNARPNCWLRWWVVAVDQEPEQLRLCHGEAPFEPMASIEAYHRSATVFLATPLTGTIHYAQFETLAQLHEFRSRAAQLGYHLAWSAVGKELLKGNDEPAEEPCDGQSADHLP